MEKDAAGVEEAAEVVGLVSVLRGRWKDATAELAAKLKDKEATNAALVARRRLCSRTCMLVLPPWWRGGAAVSGHTHLKQNKPNI